MKRFIYSSYTKFVALVLIVCSLAFALNLVLDTIYTYTNEQQLYGFEESFESSRYFAAFLNDPSGAVYNAYSQYHHQHNSEYCLPFPMNEELQKLNLQKMNL